MHNDDNNSSSSFCELGASGAAPGFLPLMADRCERCGGTLVLDDDGEDVCMMCARHPNAKKVEVELTAGGRLSAGGVFGRKKG